MGLSHIYPLAIRLLSFLLVSMLHVKQEDEHNDYSSPLFARALIHLLSPGRPPPHMLSVSAKMTNVPTLPETGHSVPQSLVAGNFVFMGVLSLTSQPCWWSNCCLYSIWLRAFLIDLSLHMLYSACYLLHVGFIIVQIIWGIKIIY
jgi:hypothetical protein